MQIILKKYFKGTFIDSINMKPLNAVFCLLTDINKLI